MFHIMHIGRAFTCDFTSHMVAQHPICRLSARYLHALEHTRVLRTARVACRQPSPSPNHQRDSCGLRSHRLSHRAQTPTYAPLPATRHGMLCVCGLGGHATLLYRSSSFEIHLRLHFFFLPLPFFSSSANLSASATSRACESMGTSISGSWHQPMRVHDAKSRGSWHAHRGGGIGVRRGGSAHLDPRGVGSHLPLPARGRDRSSYPSHRRHLRRLPADAIDRIAEHLARHGEERCA